MANQPGNAAAAAAAADAAGDEYTIAEIALWRAGWQDGWRAGYDRGVSDEFGIALITDAELARFIALLHQEAERRMAAP